MFSENITKKKIEIAKHCILLTENGCMPVACSLQPAAHPRARAAYLVCILGLSQVADFRKCCRTPAESEKCRHIQCRWLCCFTKLHFRRGIAQFHCIWSRLLDSHTSPSRRSRDSDKVHSVDRGFFFSPSLQTTIGPLHLLACTYIF